jgi:hypothetical protein
VTVTNRYCDISICRHNFEKFLFTTSSMFAQKRKRTGHYDGSDPEASSSFEQALSDNEIDISSALTGKKAKIRAPNAEDSDDELNQLIQNSIAKRNVKGGTEVLKKAKGRAKMTKGEVGGGSFQSMGRRFSETYPVEMLTFCARSSPLFIALFDFARIPHTNPNTASLHSRSPGKPSSGSGGHGPYWLW